MIRYNSRMEGIGFGLCMLLLLGAQVARGQDSIAVEPPPDYRVRVVYKWDNMIIKQATHFIFKHGMMW